MGKTDFGFARPVMHNEPQTALDLVHIFTNFGYADGKGFVINMTAFACAAYGCSDQTDQYNGQQDKENDIAGFGFAM